MSQPTQTPPTAPAEVAGEQPPAASQGLDRRQFLTTVVGGGAATYILAACGGEGGSSNTSQESTDESAGSTSTEADANLELEPQDTAEGYTIFATMPKDKESAVGMAAEFAGRLKQIPEGRTPLINLEVPARHPDTPEAEAPGAIDIRAVDWDAVRTYLQELSNQGVQGEMTWYSFTEANIPEQGVGDDYGNTDPQLFQSNTRRFAQEMKAVFPDAKVGVLLDSATYESYDYEHWATGTYSGDALKRYVDGLGDVVDGGLAIQGFHYGDWNTDPAEYLQAGPIMEAAAVLGADITLVTGTFSKMVPPATEVVTEATLGEREGMLDGVVAQADQIRQGGYDTTVSLFEEDKVERYPEGEQEANWAYETPDERAVRARFLNNLTSKGVKFTTFQG